jgi:hypothetical protein
MNPGTQIAYIPTHANGDLAHPDVEFGFVVSERDNIHFCRYWRRSDPGVLRTVANSEATPTDMLIEHMSVNQYIVNRTLAKVTALAEEPPTCDCVPGHLCELHADEEKNEPEPFCPACEAGIGQCNGPHKGNAGEVPY